MVTGKCCKTITYYHHHRYILLLCIVYLVSCDFVALSKCIEMEISITSIHKKNNEFQRFCTCIRICEHLPSFDEVKLISMNHLIIRLFVTNTNFVCAELIEKLAIQNELTLCVYNFCGSAFWKLYVDEYFHYLSVKEHGTILTSWRFSKKSRWMFIPNLNFNGNRNSYAKKSKTYCWIALIKHNRCFLEYSSHSQTNEGNDFWSMTTYLG